MPEGDIKTSRRKSSDESWPERYLWLQMLPAAPILYTVPLLSQVSSGLVTVYLRRDMTVECSGVAIVVPLHGQIIIWYLKFRLPNWALFNAVPVLQHSIST